MPTATEIIEFHNQCAADINAIKNKRMGRLHDDIKAIFDAFPDLHRLILIGFTPSHNDGDTPEHTIADPVLNDYDEWDSKKDRTALPVLLPADKTAIKKVLRKLDAAVFDKYNTDYRIVVTRKEDAIIIKHGAYEGGY